MLHKFGYMKFRGLMSTTKYRLHNSSRIYEEHGPAKASILNKLFLCIGDDRQQKYQDRGSQGRLQMQKTYIDSVEEYPQRKILTNQFKDDSIQPKKVLVHRSEINSLQNLKKRRKQLSYVVGSHQCQLNKKKEIPKTLPIVVMILFLAFYSTLPYSLASLSILQCQTTILRYPKKTNR
uniref:Uncharacterized protein n=1 Tax=Glossina pallidipes TaxID=7398 RepID=A0A1A9Z439_GLOPL